MLKQKNTNKKAKVKYYRENLEYREQEIGKKDEIIRKLSANIEEAEKRLRKMQLKLRQQEVTRIKDLQKKVESRRHRSKR